MTFDPVLLYVYVPVPKPVKIWECGCITFNPQPDYKQNRGNADTVIVRLTVSFGVEKVVKGCSCLENQQLTWSLRSDGRCLLPGSSGTQNIAFPQT